MRKKVFGRQFSRGRKARKALFRSLMRAIVINGKITTTKEKGKALVYFFKKEVNIAKKGGLSALRLILSDLGNDREVTQKIMEFSKNPQNQIKSIPLGVRRGDNAEMISIELIQKASEVKKTKSEVSTEKVSSVKKKSA